MEKYELLFILPAKFTEPELAEQMEKIKGVVAAAGGSVSEAHDMGRRKLAYPIKNNRNGNYCLFFVEAETPVIAKLNEIFRLSTEILRHLIIVRDPNITKIPSFAEEERRERERQEAPMARPQAPAPVPQQAPLQPAKERITMEELDKKLDEILTDDII